MHYSRLFSVWSALIILASPVTAQFNLMDVETIEPLPILTSGSSNEFGDALASGDFNGDSAMDLVVGMPGWAGGGFNSGTAYVLIAAGESYTHFIINQDTPGAPGVAEANDDFAETLAVGDFNCDQLDDLAVGAPGETVGAVDRAGAVSVFYGAPDTADVFKLGSQLFHQDSVGIQGVAEVLDRFGDNLVAADFDQDGCDDLVIAASAETINGVDQAGAVHLFFGSSSGLTSTDNLLINAASLPNGSTFEGFFGAELNVVDSAGLPPRFLVSEPNANDTSRGTQRNGAVHLFAVQTAPSRSLVLLNSMYGEGSERFGFGAHDHHQGVLLESLLVSSLPVGGVASQWQVESDLSARAPWAPVLEDSGSPVQARAIGRIDGQLLHVDEVRTSFNLFQRSITFSMSRGSTALGGSVRQWNLDTVDPDDDSRFGQQLLLAPSRQDNFNSVFIASPLAGDHGKVYRVYAEWLFGDGFEGGSAFHWSSTQP